MGMYDEYCLWAQVAVLLLLGLYCTVWDRYMQVLYLGRAPRTKKTLPDFLEKFRVARHSRVFRGLTGSQQTLGFWVVTSEVFGPRRKAVLLREAYVWTPVLGVFDKFREVGDLSYLSFILYLSVL